MINEMMSGGGMGFTSGLGGMVNPLGDGPMGIAKRVAADIAAKEIDKDHEDDDSASPDAPGQQDPMAEIMGIISMLSSPPQNTKSLEVDKVFRDRCEQIYPATKVM